LFKKILLSFLLVLSVALVATSAKAATIAPGPLTITYEGDDQIFSKINIEPGDKIRKDLTVTNNGRVAHNLAIATKNVSGELGSKIYVSAIENDIVIWTNTILELSSLTTASKFITSLNPGQTKIISLEANFPENSENDAAGKTVNFDIIYGTEESEPQRTNVSILSTGQSVVASTTPSPSTTASSAPGVVKGEETKSDGGLNPWYLLIAPAAFAASLVFLPEFLIAGSLSAIGGGASYFLGYSSVGSMNPTLFYSILVIEIFILIIMAYYMFHHDNRASRRIRGYKHRLRIR
jgi:hypothetical protein